MKVAVSKCTDYDFDKLYGIISSQLSEIGDGNELFNSKKVLIKPNIVISKGPEHAATTHPNVVKAVIRYIKQFSPEEIILAESYGGPYTELSLKNYYRTSGIAAVCEEEGTELNFNTSSSTMYYPDGKVCKSFNVITPVHNADVIVDVCKLKTHSLSKMSCAVKNFFGVIPGIEKFEMHARYSEHKNFFAMLCDLCEMLTKTKTIIAVCDGIVGMEGNGPTGGNPRAMNVVLSSVSPFALDVVAEHILNFDGTTPLVTEAMQRGICDTLENTEIICENLESLVINDIKLPDASSLKFLTKMPDLFGGRFAKFFQPVPEIRKKTCIGCGTCVKSCPVHTIRIENKKAIINHDNCIRCFCCQELCPINSVYIKKNVFLKIAQKL